ncbi:MAG TPA: ABC transporter ATP-binding protein [Gemmatimonadaceae bacterium]|nr:ABC transporter ATP-binding protein [Gemmatimonadaceae bacterium]
MRFSIARALIIARREYLTTVRRKAFIFWLLYTPTILFFSTFLSHKLQEDDSRARFRKERVVALVDSSGVYANAPREFVYTPSREDADTARAGAAPAAGAAGEPLLEVRALDAGYGVRDVLRTLSLTVPRGAVAAWMGENGVGKSTLARAIMGLVPARGGSIRVDGTVLDALPVEARARHVGLVFQNPSAQLFAPTVREEALFGPRALGLPRAQAVAGAEEALAAVGLEGEMARNPADLAPQAQRRLAIAAAMAARPPMLILDEPTAGQDAAGRAWIARALALQARRGAAAVITHDERFAASHCGLRVTFAGGQVSDIRGVSPQAR